MTVFDRLKPTVDHAKEYMLKFEKRGDLNDSFLRRVI